VTAEHRADPARFFICESTRGLASRLHGSGMMRSFWQVVYVLLSVATALWLGACASNREETLVAPEISVSPYDSLRGEPLWAVAPLNNESGTSAADVMKISDAMVSKVQEVRGVSCIPMNRTLLAMRRLGMSRVSSPADAVKLAEALGVDAIIAGSITAYDPYDPPRIGLTLGLFQRPERTGGDDRSPDAIRLLTKAGQEREVKSSAFGLQPKSVVSTLYDARNHETLMQVRRYAVGRMDASSPMGWRAYTLRTGLYIEFVTAQAISELLDAERVRMASAN
jgi:hypothetical protein